MDNRKPCENQIVDINIKILMDLYQISNGGYAPLRRFMGSGDLESVLSRDMLETGEVWTVPVILNVSTGDQIITGDTVCLHYLGRHIAEMKVEERFSIDRNLYASILYGTESLEHPGVREVFTEPATCISGDVGNIQFPDFIRSNPTPVETRELFKRMGWKTVAAFQSRNPPHRAHEFMHRRAMELVDGLFINPVAGDLKEDDFSGEEIMRAYRHFVSMYYPREKVVLSPLMISMRYAGPRAAVFLAQIRKNYGCTHFIVGRDMAGVGKYYDPYAAQKAIENSGIGIELIKFQEVFFCEQCGETVDERSCGHGDKERRYVSMSSIRKSLKQGIFPPLEIMRKDVAEILIHGNSAHSSEA